MKVLKAKTSDLHWAHKLNWQVDVPAQEPLGTHSSKDLVAEFLKIGLIARVAFFPP